MMIRTGMISFISPQARRHIPIFAWMSTPSRLSAISNTHSISQVICLTVHVPLPSVHKQKQIPLNAKTACQQEGAVRLPAGHSLTSAIKLT
jgi:hypothetical protein